MTVLAPAHIAGDNICGALLNASEVIVVLCASFLRTLYQSGSVPVAEDIPIVIGVIEPLTPIRGTCNYEIDEMTWQPSNQIPGITGQDCRSGGFELWRKLSRLFSMGVQR